MWKLKNFIFEAIVAINVFPKLIFGRGYRKCIHRIENFDGSLESRLLSIIARAIGETPYYREKYADLHFNSIEDFSNNFPLIDKQVVVDNFSKFVSDAAVSYDLVTTGGTTGAPMKFLVPKDRYQTEYAHIHSIWKRGGYDFSARAVLRNHRIGPSKYSVNPVTKEYQFDGFINTPEHYNYVYGVMKKKRIQFFHAYTSNAYEFFNYLVDNRFDISFIKCIFTASENLLPHQNEFFKNLPVKHVNFYGHSEKLALAGFCPICDVYHFEETYGYVELLNEKGVQASTDGERCEIVATTLNNSVFPLLRYRTYDYAIFHAGPSRCGHIGKSVKSILGRWGGERIYNSDFSYVTTTALNLHADLYSRIKGIQYIQVTPGELQVSLVRAENFTVADEKMLMESIKSVMKHDFIVTIRSVTHVQKLDNGKSPLLISHVKISE